MDTGYQNLEDLIEGATVRRISHVPKPAPEEVATVKKSPQETRKEILRIAHENASRAAKHFDEAVAWMGITRASDISKEDRELSLQLNRYATSIAEMRKIFEE